MRKKNLEVKFSREFSTWKQKEKIEKSNAVKKKRNKEKSVKIDIYSLGLKDIRTKRKKISFLQTLYLELINVH